MERKLSQSQRDQILMSTAREEVIMKKNLLEVFAQSNKAFETSVAKMTDCLTTLNGGIAAAMQMMAMAMSGQTQAFPPNTQWQYMNQAPTNGMFAGSGVDGYSNSHPSSGNSFFGPEIQSRQLPNEARRSFGPGTSHNSSYSTDTSVYTDTSVSDSQRDTYFEL